jgi:sugar lactone lactonase YvrE
MRDDVARALAARALEVAQKTKSQQGPKGEKGDAGQIIVQPNKGDKGDTGPMGPQGIPGKSITGPKGDKGDKGDPGQKGDKGDKGESGAKGDTGERGERGFQGLKGLDGSKGDIGPMPKHEKKGLMIRFEKEPGTWGEWIVMPTGGGGGGRDDKLTDRQAELVALAEFYKTRGSNTNKYIKSDGTNLTWDTLDASDITGFGANTGITGWNYSGLSKSISAEESAPSGLFFSPDGLNMYVNGSTGDDVNQYTLSTAFNVSTATYVRVFSTAAQDTSPQDVFFKPDGLTMYVIGSTNDTVFQYTLSSAWNISTASYASKSFSVTSQETNPTGLWFKPDGTVMYVIGTTNDTVFQYNLATAWDVSTASYASISFDINSQESTPNQVNLSADGLTMWILGATGDDINQYALGTAFNVSTAVFENNFYIGFQETNPQGLFIDSTASNRVYVLGTGTDAVYQYNTATNSISAVTDVFNTTSNARVQGNLAVQSNAYVDGTLVVQGNITTSGSTSLSTTSVSGTLSATSTLSGTSTITLSGTTSSTTTLGTSATTGTTTIGGTSQTGTITVGQSTVSQTTNIQAGATASGSTKTMNIGTAGLSGSTTAINIGSAVSGATSTTTLNGLVIDSISAAVSAAGTTQGTATGLVSNINNVTVVTAAAAGVRLPTAVAGMRILVRNSDSADTLSIYPATGGTINALAANAAFTLAAGSTIELVATTTTQWYTF